jgi:hypothetical protein
MRLAMRVAVFGATTILIIGVLVDAMPLNKVPGTAGGQHGVQDNVVSAGVNEFIIPNYKLTWGVIRKAPTAKAERRSGIA